MKLIRFAVETGTGPYFGVVIKDRAVSFSVLQSKAGTSHHYLSDSRSYLANLPHSEESAKDLCNWGLQHFEELEASESFALDRVRLKVPVEVTALFDFGLTPRHLQNSAETMLKYDLDDPKVALVLQAAGQLLTDRPSPPPGEPEPLLYYKCNMNSIAGDNETIPWPRYTSRLDIEPELAVIYGNPKQPVAGFCIFNDVSARDVQTPEFIGGFSRSKDMARGNQLGPCLITLDEVENPYQLEVSVAVNGAIKYQGSTAEISHTAEDIFAYMETIAPLQPGNTFGFGTIPDCTGLDHDDFIDPGAQIDITFEKLGTLKCRFAEPDSALFPSRWPLRETMKKYHAE
jgi:2-keto-4-pentenoate hydratase/2-oxohepta-3-ene-1,7-dioic acid hydratase in catechol pathway